LASFCTLHYLILYLHDGESARRDSNEEGTKYSVWWWNLMKQCHGMVICFNILPRNRFHYYFTNIFNLWLKIVQVNNRCAGPVINANDNLIINKAKRLVLKCLKR